MFSRGFGPVLLAALLLTTNAAARSSPPPLSVVGAAFALSVPNLDSTVAWYTRNFGMRVVARPPAGNTRVALLEGGGLSVEVIQHPNARPSPAGAQADPVLTHGIMKVGMLVTNFDSTVAALRTHGVAFAYGPFPATPAQRANVIIRDHDGNLIQLFGR